MMTLTKLKGTDNGDKTFTYSVTVAAATDEDLAAGGGAVSLCNDEPDPNKAFAEVQKILASVEGVTVSVTAPTAPAVS